MRKLWFFIVLVALSAAFGGCSREKAEPAAEAIDTVPMLVTRIQECSRLYTTECQLHKIITHDDKMTIKGELLKEKINIDLPLGQRRIAIPMDATVKAYIDFADFSAANVKKDGERVTITLPDPKVELTSTRINHDEVRKYVPMLRSNFSDAELTSYEQQGRQAIIESLPQLGLIEKARLSAAHTLIPIFATMGFRQEDVTITFRKDLRLKDVLETAKNKS